MRERSWPLVTVDIDGTLTTVHGWKVIAAAFGRMDAFDRTQRDFYAKAIGEDQHLENMLRIAEGRPLAAVEAALESTPRLAGVSEGVAFLRSRGTRVALLTHNPRYVCEWYVRRFGFDDYEGVEGQSVANGLVGAPHEIRADKRGGLERLAARAGTPRTGVVHVGDGWADAVLFPRVGRGVALNSRLDDVNRAADVVLSTDDFAEVARRIAALGPRP